MYNKYPSMKKYQLKEAIKNEIISTLSKGSLNENAPGFANRKMGDPLPTLESVKAAYEAKKEKVNEKNRDLREDEDLKESFNIKLLPDLDRFIKEIAKRYDYSKREAVFAIKAAMKQRDADGVNEDLREEKETLDSVLKKIKDELEIYKTSKDTDKKKAAVEKLKDLNKNKKDLLNKEEEKIASIGKDQELDV
tara:strand:+ start:305 stop:883 length:579 start_codon:yes stop_codon:yes gene_type:complete